MEPDFWHNKWEQKQIGFHLDDTNPHLLAHFPQLNLKSGSRLFLPLCGKTRDIAWLLAQGYQVVGAELSEIAVTELFAELALQPEAESLADLKRYQAENICIYQGDIFQLEPSMLGEIDAIYDRAALVALPATMRKAYSQHLLTLTGKARQLLISFDYDQSLMAGPPFCIVSNEINTLYAAHYHITHLAHHPLPDGLKGVVPAVENIWLLETKTADALFK